MRFVRSVPVIVAVWVTIVTMGSSIVWGVISAAGQDVVTARAPIGMPTTPVFPEAGTTRTSGEAHRPATTTSRNADTARTPVPRPTAPAAADHASPAALPVELPVELPVALPPVSPAGSEHLASQAPTVALRVVRTATWQGLGGLVTARCVGAAISLVDAEPADGYSLAIQDPGPESVAVDLHGVGGSEVRAECVSGTPSFLAESD